MFIFFSFFLALWKVQRREIKQKQGVSTSKRMIWVHFSTENWCQSAIFRLKTIFGRLFWLNHLPNFSLESSQIFLRFSSRILVRKKTKYAKINDLESPKMVFAVLKPRRRRKILGTQSQLTTSPLLSGDLKQGGIFVKFFSDGIWILKKKGSEKW